MPGRAPSRTTGDRAAALAADDARTLAAALAIAPVDPAGVHEARKSVRRLRSLLALGRRALGKDAVDAIDDELRALAKGLSALRDGQVAQEMARQMARDAEDSAEVSNWKGLLPLLEERQRHRLTEALYDDPGFMRRQARAHRLATQLQQLPWRRLRSDDLRVALARSVRRQAHAQAAALASSQLDDLHAWRRRSRRLRMQLSALRKLRVRAQAPGHRDTNTLKHIARLVDQLGVLQDLALLHQALEAMEQVQLHGLPVATRHRLAKPLPIQPLG